MFLFIFVAILLLLSTKPYLCKGITNLQSCQPELQKKQINNQQPLEVKTKNINAQIISEGGGDVLWDILYKDDKYYVVWKECFSE